MNSVGLAADPLRRKPELVWSQSNWSYSLLLPVCSVCISATLLVLSVGWRAIGNRKVERVKRAPDAPERHAEDLDRWTLKFTKLKSSPRALNNGLLLIISVSMVGLNALTLLLCNSDEQRCPNNGQSYDHAHDFFARLQVFSPLITSTYTSCLAMISIFSRTKHAAIHLRLVLAALLVTYLYRDVWPLATYTLHPRDHGEGLLLVLKVLLLIIGAVVIPLFTRRVYIPVDPKHPASSLNAEQTSSWAAIIFYTFMDSIIRRAHQLSHLPYNEYPPLPDYDYANNLVKRCYPHLDPFSKAKKQHLFWGLVASFPDVYATISVIILFVALAPFARPLGINGILRYLETNGEDAYVKPWAWLLALFLGPLIFSVAMQFYAFQNCRMLVRCEAILKQLIFDHSLRIRMANSQLGNDNSDGNKDVRDHKGNLIGRLNNLATTDVANVVDGGDFPYMFFCMPIQFVVALYYLYYFLGWSSFVGFAVLLLLFPLPGYIARRIRVVQVQTMKKTDARVQTVTETLSVLRMIKLFGWERKVHDDVEQKREEELQLMWKRKLFELLNNIVNYIVPAAQMISTYLTFTLIMKKPLSASVVFSTLSVFDIIRGLLSSIIGQIPRYIQAKVSLDRVHSFLTETELLDGFDGSKSVDVHAEDPHAIIIRDAAFTWSSRSDEGDGRFRLCIDQELRFVQGSVNLILGPTGSGKTSLLMAMLGEMRYIPLSPASCVHLPRDRGIAYAAQESWVQNATIRDNILFGSEYDEARYNKVIYQCALRRDLSLFTDGDRTEVGEKGLTLSGGQKARVTLARAVYSTAHIVLLDDVLSALDVHTAKWVVEKCLQGDLLNGRTVLLVTHNVALASAVSEFAISLGMDGRVLSQGSVHDALEKNSILAEELGRDSEKLALASAKTDVEDFEPVSVVPQSTEQLQPAAKLIVAEEIAIGHVARDAIKTYLVALGGDQVLSYWILMISAYVALQISSAGQTWFLGYWAQQYDLQDPSQVRVGYYLLIYTLLVASAVIVNTGYFTMFTFGQLRASRSLHRRLLDSVLATTWRWLDITPSARIIARCTQDIRSVDTSVGETLSKLIAQTISMLVKLVAVIFFTPIFILPGILLTALGYVCGQIYIKAQLSIRREMSVARAPILSHFNATMAGIVSIRAYGAQAAFHEESLHRIDRFTRSARLFYDVNRWVNIRIDLLGYIFATSLATYLVYGSDVPTAADAGFSLTMAIGFSSMVLWWIRILNEFEVSTNSLERIESYIGVESERKPTAEGRPPAHWPSSGSLRVEGLSARYSFDGPAVLKSVSFELKSGERLGVVGRTGSGKTSLTLALLGCIPTDGTVYYDGLRTSSVNLDMLRSNITIIPQSPELMSDTLRRNLDPFDEYDDATLVDALRSAGFFAPDEVLNGQQLGLDSQISSGGANLSFGQRQILAMARALVRRSKLLILDEATSGVDHATDGHIQRTLRDELDKDVSVIVIAHRLHTVMALDKIIVLDSGRVVESGTPTILLSQEESAFKALVDESGDRENLYHLVYSKS